MHTHLHKLLFLLALVMLGVSNSGYSQHFLACRVYYYYGSDSLNLHKHESIINNDWGKIITKSTFTPDSTKQKAPWQLSTTFYYYEEDTILKREHFFTSSRHEETLYEYDNRNLLVVKKHYRYDDTLSMSSYRNRGYVLPEKDSIYTDYSLTYSYNDHNQVISVDYAYCNLANLPFRHVIYTWDYDSLNRVVKHEGRDSDGELMIQHIYTYFDNGYELTTSVYTYDFETPWYHADSPPMKELKMQERILVNDRGNPVTKIRLDEDGTPFEFTYYIYDSKNRVIKEIICDDSKVPLPKKTFIYYYDELPGGRPIEKVFWEE